MKTPKHTTTYNEKLSYEDSLTNSHGLMKTKPTTLYYKKRWMIRKKKSGRKWKERQQKASFWFLGIIERLIWKISHEQRRFYLAFYSWFSLLFLVFFYFWAGLVWKQSETWYLYPHHARNATHRNARIAQHEQQVLDGHHLKREEEGGGKEEKIDRLGKMRGGGTKYLV